MKETEILRGLGKAKAKHFMQAANRNKFADGMVPDDPVEATNRRIRAYNAELAAKGMLASPQAAAPAAAAAPAPAADPAPQPTSMFGGLRRAIQDRNSAMLKLEHGTPFVEAPEGVPKTGDKVPAMLEHGEAVLPAETVKAVGKQNLARLIADTNGAPPQRGLRAGAGYEGGYVDKAKAALGSVVDKAKALVTPTPAAAPAAPAAPVTATHSVPGMSPTATVSGNNPAVSTAEVRNVVSSPETGPQVRNTLGQARSATAFDVPKPGQAPVELEVTRSTGGGTTAAEQAAMDDAARARMAGPQPPASRALSAAKTLGKGALALAPLVGAVETANSTPEEDAAFANSVGAEGPVGRGLASAARFLNNTGNAATFGLAGKLGRGVANVAGGGNFFDADPAAAKPVIPAAANELSAAPATAAPAAVLPSVQTHAPGSPEARTLRGRIDDPGFVPARGEGLAVNNRTGRVMQFNAPQPKPQEPVVPKERTLQDALNDIKNAPSAAAMGTARTEARHLMRMAEIQAGKTTPDKLAIRREEEKHLDDQLTKRFAKTQTNDKGVQTSFTAPEDLRSAKEFLGRGYTDESGKKRAVDVNDPVQFQQAMLAYDVNEMSKKDTRNVLGKLAGVFVDNQPRDTSFVNKPKDVSRLSVGDAVKHGMVVDWLLGKGAVKMENGSLVGVDTFTARPEDMMELIMRSSPEQQAKIQALLGRKQ
jgi:hypothetical protein